MIRSKSKFWSLLLVMVLVLAACGGGSDDAAEEAGESSGEESVTQTTTASSSSGSSSSDSGLTGEILIDGSSTVFPITQAELPGDELKEAVTAFVATLETTTEE